MDQFASIFLTAILAGFALIIVTMLADSFLTGTIVSVLVAVGAIAVIVFAIAVLYLAIKALIKLLG